MTYHGAEGAGSLWVNEMCDLYFKYQFVGTPHKVQIVGTSYKSPP